jgi:hypothetical protein
MGRGLSRPGRGRSQPSELRQTNRRSSGSAHPAGGRDHSRASSAATDASTATAASTSRGAHPVTPPDEERWARAHCRTSRAEMAGVTSAAAVWAAEAAAHVVASSVASPAGAGKKRSSQAA